MNTLITWIDGAAAKVQADDPRIADPTIHAEVVAMRSMSKEDRRLHLNNQEDRRGPGFRARLESAFRADWLDRKKATA